MLIVLVLFLQHYDGLAIVTVCYLSVVCTTPTKDGRRVRALSRPCFNAPIGPRLNNTTLIGYPPPLCFNTETGQSFVVKIIPNPYD